MRIALVPGLVRKAGLLAAASALWLLPASGRADHHEGDGWNQGRVAAIAEALAGEFAELSLEAGRIPPDISFSQQRAQYELKEDIRLLKNTSRHLSNELKQGRGREETRPIFKRMESLRADAEENARKTLIPEPMMEQIFATGAKLLELQPYYRQDEGSSE